MPSPLDDSRSVKLTPASVEHYQVRAVLRARGSYAEDEWSIFQSVDFDGEMRKNLSSQIDLEVTSKNKLLTLVTCEYTQKNGRLAVVAVK